MKNLLRGGALALALAVAWTLPAFADDPIAYTGPVVLPTGATSQGKVPVTASAPLPTTCITGCSSPVPFTPTGAASLAVTSSTGRVAFGSADATVLLENTGTTDLFFKLGSGSVTAATTDFRLSAGHSVVVAAGANTNVAAITASGTSSLAVTTGTGSPVIAGGGGTGSSSSAGYTAATSGTLAVGAGTGKPAAIDLFSAQSVLVKNPDGTAVDWTASVPIQGPAASGTTAAANPLQDGCRASTTAPTAVTDGQVVASRCSKLGNVVTSTWAPRDLQGDNAGYTATATTSAVDCVSAGASGIFRDIISITANNSSATDTVIQILDTDGTTVRWTGTAKANDMRGIAFPQPLKEVGAAASWKCKTVTSVSSVVFTIQYFETK